MKAGFHTRAARSRAGLEKISPEPFLPAEAERNKFEMKSAGPRPRRFRREYLGAFGRCTAMSNTNETTQTPPSPWETLTLREQEIALMLARGDTNREVATALGISIKTVDTHRGHIIKKLACKNNAGLVLKLVRLGKVS